MAKKMRAHLNAFLSFVLSLFGFGVQSCAMMYGVPHGDYDLSVHVINEQGESLEGIHVIKKASDSMRGVPNDTLTTDADGRVHKKYMGDVKQDEYCLLSAEDPDSVYQTTPKVAKYRYISDNESFSWGTGVVEVEIEMKKK